MTEIELAKLAKESLEKQINDLTYLLDKTRNERDEAERRRDNLQRIIDKQPTKPV